MAPVVPDPRRIKSFANAAAFEKWLAAHHGTEPEVWIKIHKKDSGLASVTAAQALEVVLCWGWIDGTRKGFDERSFLQRYTPRGRKSIWSQINRDHVARLTADGRMTPDGQREVDAAKADGRWDAAYAPMRATTAETVPDDLRAAIEASPRAKRAFGTLSKMNLFALAFRTNAMKTPAGRARKIDELVAMLARGGTIVPNPAPRTQAKTAGARRDVHPDRRSPMVTKKSAVKSVKKTAKAVKKTAKAASRKAASAAKAVEKATRKPRKQAKKAVAAGTKRARAAAAAGTRKAAVGARKALTAAGKTVENVTNKMADKIAP
jgi:uncharacterized protein YdeI (YjbR/CyaY-like superfamily)